MSSNETIQVGIVIPNHNYGKWVGKAILSAVNEPYKNKKLVVVDDGSTDISWPIICKTLNLPDIRSNAVLKGDCGGIECYAYRFDTAGGPSRARNKGIKILEEQTDLFFFLDSDDEFLTGKIVKTVNKFEQDRLHTGAIYTDYFIVNEETGYSSVEYKEPFSRQRLVQECIVHSACAINKKVFNKVGLYDEEMRTCEDYDLWMRISERFLITHIPEPLMLVRVGNHNSTATVKSEVWQKNWRRVMEKAQERIKNGK